MTYWTEGHKSAVGRYVMYSYCQIAGRLILAGCFTTAPSLFRGKKESLCVISLYGFGIGGGGRTSSDLNLQPTSTSIM